MGNGSSKDHSSSFQELEVANPSAPSAASSHSSGDPYVLEALGIIVSAFVDLGFGVSAVQQAKNAANDNRDLIRIAADFPARPS